MFPSIRRAKKTLLLTDSPNSLIWCQWRRDDYDFTYLINLYLFVEIIQGWSFFIPNLLSSCHFLGVEESLFWQSHSSTGTECGGSSWAAVGPEYRQNHKWGTWLTTKACTDLNFFSRPYFHHCLRSVHYCEGRFHIHFLNRNSHIWFSYTHSHEQSSYRKCRTEKERNWTGNQCRISHAIQSLTYGPNIFAMCLLQYRFQIPTIYLVFRQANSSSNKFNHLITMIRHTKWKTWCENNLPRVSFFLFPGFFWCLWCSGSYKLGSVHFPWMSHYISCEKLLKCSLYILYP